MLYNLTLCRRCLAKLVSGQQIRLKSHYAVLGVSQTASQQEIRHAFIELSKKHHPDQGGSGSHEKFVKINEAYSVLSKPLSRQEYDLSTTQRYSSFSHESAESFYRRYPFKPGSRGNPGQHGYDPYSRDNPFYRGQYGPYGPFSQDPKGQQKQDDYKEGPFSKDDYKQYQEERSKPQPGLNDRFMQQIIFFGVLYYMFCLCITLSRAGGGGGLEGRRKHKDEMDAFVGAADSLRRKKSNMPPPDLDRE